MSVYKGLLEKSKSTYFPSRKYDVLYNLIYAFPVRCIRKN